MAHWGWYWRVKNKGHITRKLCSSLVAIDSFTIFKNNPNTGFTVQPLQIRAEPSAGCLKITYRNHKNSSYNIPVEQQPCHFGGFRYFFRCPLCDRRMRILYLAQNSLFLCRKCLNLAYETQFLRPVRRYDYMDSKLKNGIKDRGGNIDFWQRPPHMHERTYQNIRSKLIDYEFKAEDAIENELRQWFGDKAEHFL